MSTGSEIEKSLVLSERSVAVTLVGGFAVEDGRRIVSCVTCVLVVLFLHVVRTLGRLQLHFERILLWPQSTRPFVVVDVRVHIVEPVVAELLFAPGV